MAILVGTVAALAGVAEPRLQETPFVAPVADQHLVLVVVVPPFAAGAYPFVLAHLSSPLYQRRLRVRAGYVAGSAYHATAARIEGVPSPDPLSVQQVVRVGPVMLPPVAVNGF